MGYNTDFYGRFEFDEELDLETINKLEKLADERHDDDGFPGIWCQWIVTDGGKFLEWDGEEKFYNYVEWLEYIIKNIIKPKGYFLNGEVEWDGERRCDIGLIVVKDNVVSAKIGSLGIVYN